MALGNHDRRRNPLHCIRISLSPAISAPVSTMSWGFPAPSLSPPPAKHTTLLLFQSLSPSSFALWFMFMSSLSKSSNCVNICLASCIPSSLSLNRACRAAQRQTSESERGDRSPRSGMNKANPPIRRPNAPTDRATDRPTDRPTDWVSRPTLHWVKFCIRNARPSLSWHSGKRTKKLSRLVQKQHVSLHLHPLNKGVNNF